ncbi:protein-L-isoaspartate(D-aspartate) O-methyltransferase [Streptomyces sp. NBC_01803]|uniref:protein-L-isoaspartate(D-aspartate) O-methyltransferase n=1 Tax=Streptomyces sp. NBC_01803 TaxID=2975946 RepID=UPI002DD82308|nr:protein-L-isoaspartate(D-aspartate) O-methyltransferase [Streptomyces sp. NBC_01803]WSA44283.1 protein-L-isoaspartate(D-aspartate) O-methyltransferase [Streptomyces sp. NBC_01803]
MTTAIRPAEELRRELADALAAEGLLRGDRWHAAFAAVPREIFVSDLHTHRPGEPEYLAAVHADEPLLGVRPGTAAAMLEALDAGLAGQGRVLEVGQGNGYGAALLCHGLGDDRVVSLATEDAAARMAGAGFAPTTVIGDAARGCPEHAPYAGLLAVSATGRVPAAWAAQVVPGGTVVVALRLGIAVLTVREDGSAEGPFLPVLDRPSAVTPPGARSYIPALLVPLGRQAEVAVPADPGADMARFLCGLAQPDAHELCLIDADGRRLYGVVHPASDSWARLAPREDGTARIQYDGPRDLWAERAALLADWTAAGRPGPERYGLTVGADGSHRLWLDSPDDGPSRPLPPPSERAA